MTKCYIRYTKDTGAFMALLTIENHYPEPVPRSDDEGVLRLTDDQYVKASLAPNKWNYADGTMTPLIEGRLSVSSLKFYADVEGFDELHPELDNVVEIQPQFPDLPKGELIKVRVNTGDYELPNYGVSGKIRSPKTGIFAISLTDARVTAEQMTFYANCLARPETTDGH